MAEQYIGTLAVKLGMNTQGFSSGLATARRQMKQTLREIEQMSQGIKPFGGMSRVDTLRKALGGAAQARPDKWMLSEAFGGEKFDTSASGQYLRAKAIQQKLYGGTERNLGQADWQQSYRTMRRSEVPHAGAGGPGGAAMSGGGALNTAYVKALVPLGKMVVYARALEAGIDAATVSLHLWKGEGEKALEVIRGMPGGIGMVWQASERLRASWDGTAEMEEKFAQQLSTTNKFLEARAALLEHSQGAQKRGAEVVKDAERQAAIENAPENQRQLIQIDFERRDAVQQELDKLADFKSRYAGRKEMVVAAERDTQRAIANIQHAASVRSQAEQGRLAKEAAEEAQRQREKDAQEAERQEQRKVENAERRVDIGRDIERDRIQAMAEQAGVIESRRLEAVAVNPMFSGVGNAERDKQVTEMKTQSKLLERILRAAERGQQLAKLDVP